MRFIDSGHAGKTKRDTRKNRKGARDFSKKGHAKITKRDTRFYPKQARAFRPKIRVWLDVFSLLARKGTRHFSKKGQAILGGFGHAVFPKKDMRKTRARKGQNGMSGHAKTPCPEMPK